MVEKEVNRNFVESFVNQVALKVIESALLKAQEDIDRALFLKTSKSKGKLPSADSTAASNEAMILIEKARAAVGLETLQNLPEVDASNPTD